MPGTAAQSPLLAVRDVTMRFGGIVALDHVSFDIGDGEIVGLIGPNGAGKTTLFNCVSQLYTPNEGSVLLAGRSILGLGPHRVAALGVGRTFQNLALFSTLTVLQNVMIGIHARTHSGFLANALRLSSVRREERQMHDAAMELLAFLELTAVAHHPAAGLPFGTLKRVELARAMAGQPRLLLLDEPAGGLNHEEVGITTILGADGAGKTTTLRAVSGLVSTEGSVHFAGGRIDGRALEDLVRAGIAHVPEGRGTFVGLTVEENLRLGAYARRERARSDDFERVYQYFPILRERRRQVAGTLSGGEQQMLAIARALMLSPRLLLLDEPSLGLAPLVMREIFRIVRAINRDHGVSVLLVEQNAAIALELADHAHVLEAGRVVLAGPPAILTQDGAVRRSYLGY